MKRMWQSIVAFLASSKVLAMLLENIIKQGFSVLLLVAAVLWMRGEIQLVKKELELTKMKVEQCNTDMLTYYKEDRVRTEMILQQATDIMKQLSRKLDNE